MLPSIEIKNFRVFEHLKIDKLCQINLITGKNNVGKTTLLEAINILISEGSPRALQPVIDPVLFDNYKKQLFHNCQTENNITIESAESKSIVINRDVNPLSPTERKRPFNGFSITKGGGIPNAIHNAEELIKLLATNNGSNARFVPSYGLNPQYLYKRWNEIALTPKEDEVVNGLQIIDPSISRIAILPYDNNEKQLFKIRKNGIDTSMSMQSLGGGLQRLFEIVIVLVECKDNALLIDEIENGLHYSIQPQVWKLIFEMSKRLNVQVFATTHSWDCLEAFQEAANEHKDVSSQMIRLSQLKQKIVPTLFSPEDISIAVEHEIEVR